jgi:hypothetical protein
MSNQTEPTKTEQAEPREGINNPGQRRRGSHVTPDSSTDSEPRVINILHQPPQPKPPHWRIPESAKAKLEAAQIAAAQASQEIEQIEGHYRDRERDLDDLKRNIRIQTKGLEVFRQGLARIDPSTLAKEWEAAYWKHVYQPFDSHTTNQWVLIASLRANSKELRAMLTRKLEEGEASIAAMEKEAAELEKELGAEAASIE